MLALSKFAGSSFYDIVDSFAVKAKSRSLLELLLAAVNVASVGEVLVMDVHVLGQVLLLRK